VRQRALQQRRVAEGVPQPALQRDEPVLHYGLRPSYFSSR
jgi:hypothetical protein